jgi:hypothetical protein
MNNKSPSCLKTTTSPTRLVGSFSQPWMSLRPSIFTSQIISEAFDLSFTTTLLSFVVPSMCLRRNPWECDKREQLWTYQNVEVAVKSRQTRLEKVWTDRWRIYDNLLFVCMLERFTSWNGTTAGHTHQGLKLLSSQWVSYECYGLVLLTEEDENWRYTSKRESWSGFSSETRSKVTKRMRIIKASDTLPLSMWFFSTRHVRD